jgi:predicted amidohydrolase
VAWIEARSAEIRDPGKGRLWATWRTLIWARAIENLALAVPCQNLFDRSERGLAVVAGPEDILYESTSPGRAIVEVSLDRLRQMRASRDEVGSSKEFSAKQGVTGPQWQRPELYDAIYPKKPLREAAE